MRLTEALCCASSSSVRNIRVSLRTVKRILNGGNRRTATRPPVAYGDRGGDHEVDGEGAACRTDCTATAS